MTFEVWPENHAERVAALNDGDPPLFLPAEFIVQRVLACTACVVVALTCVYVTAYAFLVDRFLQLLGNDSPDDDKGVLKKKRKICYQLTNFITNLCFGLAGLYYEYTLPKDLPLQETVTGYRNLVYFSAAQIGYQLWAIPLGIFYTGEQWPMIVHHFTVIVCSSMSGFLDSGFRYCTPFFYGLVELSSAPLAVMNCFKDHPVLIKRYPAFYANVRLVFAATFLYIRILMFVPREYVFLRDQALLFSTRPVLPYQIFMGTVWLSAFFLLVLQMHWASLILKGMSGGSRAKTAANNKKQN